MKISDVTTSYFRTASGKYDVPCFLRFYVNIPLKKTVGIVNYQNHRKYLSGDDEFFMKRDVFKSTLPIGLLMHQSLYNMSHASVTYPLHRLLKLVLESRESQKNMGSVFLIRDLTMGFFFEPPRNNFRQFIESPDFNDVGSWNANLV